MGKSYVSLGKAADLVGKSRSVISGYCKNYRDNTGEIRLPHREKPRGKSGVTFEIELSDLARLFPDDFKDGIPKERSEERSREPQENNSEQLKDLQIKHLEELLEAKNEALAGKDSHITDLNRQLTTVTALLEDKSRSANDAPKGFLRRLFGGV